MQKYKTVAMKDSTYDRLSEICEKVGKAKTEILSEIINEIYILVAKRDNVNISFKHDLIADLLSVQLTDRVISGSFEVPSSMPNSEVDKLVHEKIEKEIKGKVLKSEI